MDYSDIEILLKQSIGLDAAALGSAVIERAVRQRLQACCLQDWREYTSRIRSSDSELQSLIEAVVVPETWFFRDKTAFTAMVSFARDSWLPAHPAGTLRLLSAPCSSGEEPYSMAMALVDAGFALDQVHIDGWDISSQALARARHAVYGRNSFRGQDVAFRQRHFESVEDGHRVKATLRRVVSFTQTNLLSKRGPCPESVEGPALSLSKGPATSSSYDVVFCRNLLIYLDASAQDRVLRLMHQLLKPAGVLFVSPAEGSLIPRTRFARAGLPESFAFQKIEPVAKPAARKETMARKNRPPRAPDVPGLLPSLPNQSAGVGSPVGTQDAAQTHFSARLDLAKQLADLGHLPEAAQLCENYLRAHGDSAEAYYLLALVKEAGGDERTASQCYRKVLYLDPQHERALLQLALLTERQGDPEGASLLHERARRAQQRLQP